MYETRFPDPLGYGTGLNRFSDPTGKAFGLIYLGSSAKVVFVETILRDRADGRGTTCVVEYGEIEKRSLASIVTVEALVLVDLTGDGPLRMGIPSDVVGARDQSLAQRWSVAFHDHSEEPDGVLYPSRLNKELCIVLYSRALRKLKATATPLLVDCGAELAAILDDLDLAIV
ncbi:RES family NAD+ phosphorylase [Bradyrhizobium yuanmingense]|uniref:RES family NAD+ phosphorylase n=1 Tax=Bradyrhizobium yuanmingense TaxID=108015 RepID=UPI0023B89C89|nr:RES family NAD+ phosphorylase [Bradyrhizobium yuanmingense]MDF0522247.1 RES family NAD+ phosphorylase [Bradyrhizobium yuanmingense]